MNFKGAGSKLSRFNRGIIRHLYVEDKGHHENLIQDTGCPGINPNRELKEYKSTASPLN